MISMVVMSQEVAADKGYLDFVNCNKPNPSAFCDMIKGRKLPIPPKPKDRGCFPFNRCRGGQRNGQLPNIPKP